MKEEAIKAAVTLRGAVTVDQVLEDLGVARLGVKRPEVVEVMRALEMSKNAERERKLARGRKAATLVGLKNGDGAPKNGEGGENGGKDRLPLKVVQRGEGDRVVYEEGGICRARGGGGAEIVRVGEDFHGLEVIR